MAKYLDASHISSELMELLKEAKDRIILVTYSLQVNTQIQERLKTKSKLGTLAEITLIYGNTKPKQSELEWMSEIEDIKVFQKKNLHAKCYINEKKAIISSMNLYDYSQTTNVEMGFLITKEEDPEAYQKMMEDIHDLRINGERVKPWLEADANVISEKSTEDRKAEDSPQQVHSLPMKSHLSYRQQIKKQLLEEFRNEMSTQMRRKSDTILSDKAIEEIVLIEQLTKTHLKKIFDSDKKVKQIGEELIYDLERAENFVIGQVTDTRYQSDEFTYDQIKMKKFDNGAEAWYDTKKELPKKGSFVGVRLNNNWFNSYLLLVESSIAENPSNKPAKQFKNGELKLTKDLSFITGLSSRDINSTLVSYGLMEKKGNDWLATQKGENFGAKQLEGQYGKFVVWPEEILDELKLN